MFDFVGVAILIILILLFAFLTMRARRFRRPWLKWIGSFLSGLLTLVTAALLVLALTGFYKLDKRFDNPVPEVNIAASPEQIARGGQLANICVSCHTPGIQMPLSGSNFAAKFDFPPCGYTLCAEPDPVWQYRRLDRWRSHPGDPRRHRSKRPFAPGDALG